MNGNTNNTGDQTNYRAVRFGLASTLLGNGYFGFDFGTKSHAQLWQYDEYGAFLGDPKGTREDVLFPENKYLKKSVWERDFSNGKVLVNATDTIQTVRLDGEYEKLHGTQDPIVNNGAIISRVTLNAKDGLLLLRPLENVSNASHLHVCLMELDRQNEQAFLPMMPDIEAVNRSYTQILMQMDQKKPLLQIKRT
ncbi:MAG: hypothetical protein UU48_C0011G0031 [Candidatus Uhrbacteria bacterium GW2011_GWF2_41_16]|uniref:Uncharacterized protein n=1 Tax=Candidatus Uhrbacteria bacterium GW2011_GWF2_41_16 TaxID=1618997 RepID=A0A0G0V9P1_9BACT|nr:MAG: hypothetical protein UU48_C0011G0031 [Candidatus Uhrbacteria bacterium GW2011_GWF2_41_16]